jgi:molybdenum cofactor biosynthesis enzyme MoaA
VAFYGAVDGDERVMDWNEAIAEERLRAEAKTRDLTGGYRTPADCENCARARVLESGVCEKCYWDNDAHDYASVTRLYW